MWNHGTSIISHTLGIHDKRFNLGDVNIRACVCPSLCFRRWYPFWRRGSPALENKFFSFAYHSLLVSKKSGALEINCFQLFMQLIFKSIVKSKGWTFIGQTYVKFWFCSEVFVPGGLFWQDVPSTNIVFARAAFSKHETFALLHIYEATLLSSRMHHLMEPATCNHVRPMLGQPWLMASRWCRMLLWVM